MKDTLIKKELIIFFLISILPLTLFFGTFISEITIFLIGFFFFSKKLSREGMEMA
jgi:hypothetical protein